MNRIIKLLLATILITFLMACNGHNQSELIDNNNISVEYVGNDNGTWEVYVTVKNNQYVSEVNMNDRGNELLIAPDIE